MIVHRKGFGDVLANGLHEATQTIGKGSEQLAVIVKKNGLMEAAMRSHKAWALGIVTSTQRGRPSEGGTRARVPRDRP